MQRELINNDFYNQYNFLPTRKLDRDNYSIWALELYTLMCANGMKFYVDTKKSRNILQVLISIFHAL